MSCWYNPNVCHLDVPKSSPSWATLSSYIQIDSIYLAFHIVGKAHHHRPLPWVLPPPNISGALRTEELSQRLPASLVISHSHFLLVLTGSFFLWLLLHCFTLDRFCFNSFVLSKQLGHRLWWLEDSPPPQLCLQF